MARKKSKGKKPPETMRQRQMRLRKMERQLKGAKKQLPPGKKGGALVKSGPSKPMSPRLKAALDKKARAAKGTTGGSRAAGGRGLPKQTPRLPAGKSRLAKSAYAEDVRALKNLVKKGGQKAVTAAKKLAKLGVKYGPAARVLATAGAKAAPGAALAAAVARSAGRKGAAKMSRLGVSKDGNAPVKDKTSRATSRKVGPKAVEGGYTISKKARETAANLKTTKTPKTDTKKTVGTSATAKPKRQERKTTGVGPVKSGRSYSVGVSGKSVSQQRADELRQMQERSRKRQAEQRKSMEAAKKKKEQQQQQRRKRTRS